MASPNNSGAHVKQWSKQEIVKRTLTDTKQAAEFARLRAEYGRALKTGTNTEAAYNSFTIASVAEEGRLHDLEASREYKASRQGSNIAVSGTKHQANKPISLDKKLAMLSLGKSGGVGETGKANLDKTANTDACKAEPEKKHAISLASGNGVVSAERALEAGSFADGKENNKAIKDAEETPTEHAGGAPDGSDSEDSDDYYDDDDDDDDEYDDEGDWRVVGYGN